MATYCYLLCCKQTSVCNKDGLKVCGLSTALVLLTQNHSVKKKSMFHTYWKKTITVTKWDEAPTSSREVHGSVFEPQGDSRSIIKSMLCWWPNVPTSRSPPFGLTTSRGSWNGFCNRCFKVMQLLITNSTTCNSFHLKLQTSYQLGLKILHCTLNLTKAAQAASALR